MQKIPAAMVAADVATQAELDAETASRAAGDAAPVVGTRLPNGAVLQVVSSQVIGMATGTTVTPADDTVPQITEGTEFMTAAITPTSATSKLRIDVVIFLANTVTNNPVTVALHQDAAAGALAAGMQVSPGTANLTFCVHLTHYMTAGTTSATTFRVRAGANGASTTTLNGASGARLLGGTLASSITVTEVKA